MKKLVVPGVSLLLAAWCAGCGTRSPEASGAGSASRSVPAGEVRLDLKAQAETGVVVERIQVRSLPEVLQATGRITTNEIRTWRIGAITEGRIVRVFVNAGDKVSTGQILARMHSHDIHEARAEHQRAVAELDRLQGVRNYALRTRDRTRRLAELKAASLQQVEQAETELQNAEAALAHGEVELERTRRHLANFLKVPVDAPGAGGGREEEEDEALIPIISPATGTLLQRKVSEGTVVSTSGDLFVITDLSTLWMIAAVNEEHLSKLRVGMPVRVFVQAYQDRSFSGRITRLGEELDPTTRTIMAWVETPNPDGLLKPEMYATAELELGSSEPSIFVPQDALQEIDGHAMVFVRKSDDRFEARPVETGRLIANGRQVLSGLKPSDWVVTRGSFILKSQLLSGTQAGE